MNDLTLLVSMIFPKTWSQWSGIHPSDAIYKDCFSEFSKTFLIGCCGLRNMTSDTYVYSLEMSYLNMISLISTKSMSAPIQFELNNSIAELAQKQLSGCVSRLGKLIDTSELARQVAKDVFEHIVSKIGNDDVLSLVQEKTIESLEVYPDLVHEFLSENWFWLQKLKRPNRFARWCLSEFEGPKFEGVQLDEKRCKGVLTFPNGRSLTGLFVNGRLDGKGKEKMGRWIVYVGEFKDGLYDGKGLRKEHGELVYSGTFSKGLYDGWGEMPSLLYGIFFVKYVGEFELGKPHGSGKLTYANGNIYKGEFLHGKPNGIGFFSSEDVEYEGHFKDGEFHGKGSYIDTNGNSYQGEWLNGQEHGHGAYTWADGSSYEGGWMYGRQHGPGLFTSPSGRSYQGEWQKGKPHGQGEETWPNGSRFVGTYEHGEHMHGELLHDGHSFKGAVTIKSNGNSSVNLTVSLEDGTKVGFVFDSNALRFAE